MLISYIDYKIISTYIWIQCLMGFFSMFIYIFIYFSKQKFISSYYYSDGLCVSFQEKITLFSSVGNILPLSKYVFKIGAVEVKHWPKFV